MMRYKHTVIVRLAVITFVFMIIFNFYVNVWMPNRSLETDTDSLNAHDGHHNTPYVWLSSKRRHIDAFSNVNVTLNDVIPFPAVTTTSYLHMTPAYSVEPVVWPDLKHFEDDRIQNQLKYVPTRTKDSHRNSLYKKILLIHGFKYWDIKPGSQSFADQNCPVSTCALTDNAKESESADAILFRHFPKSPWFKRPPNQVWILFMLESPYATPRLRKFGNTFNWTASYRRDSEIVTPYEKFVKYQNPPKSVQELRARNYAHGKTKKVAWFVSNCRAANQRLEYARELSKYIQVDIYGACGKKRCSRKNKDCFNMLDKDYKFYLSFENANCRDYITEKFFVTGLQHDVIPIVMGAAPEDYERVAPHYSYIHVDHYGSPRVLADYLHVLDNNDDQYNEYFRWKGTGSFINTFFWCRLCAMLHEETSRDSSYYGDLEEWWRGKGVCIGKDRWRQHPRTEPYISEYYRNKKS